MKIGLVADTHLPRFGRALPAALREGLIANQVELILHMGDFTAPFVADLFREIAPFDAAAGNNDGEEIVSRFGRRKILELSGVRIGMVHGDNGRGNSTLDRAINAFSGERLDAILFGHSHVPYCQKHDRTWLINPGSPTDKRRNPAYSFGILEIRGGELIPTLHYYTDRTLSYVLCRCQRQTASP